MAITPSASANSSANSLSQKLRDLSRLKSNRSDERLERRKKKKKEEEGDGFDIIHTPDRPTRLVSPLEAPSEDECGEVIARWQRVSARERSGGGMFTRGQYGAAPADADTDAVVGQRSFGGHPPDRREGGRGEERCGLPLPRLGRQDDFAATPTMTTASDEAAGAHARHGRVTRLVHGGREVGRGGHGQQTQTGTGLLHHGQPPLEPRPPAPARAADTGYGKQQQQPEAGVTGYQHGNTRANYVAAKASPIPSPLFSSTARPLPPTSHPRSMNPGLVTVAGGNSLLKPRYTGGMYPDSDGDGADEGPVDMEQLVRMEIYPRGFCPYCRKYFGNHPLPLECPYLDCRRDLKACLQYPNRREATKAPPRLAQRAFLDIRPRGHVKGNGFQPRATGKGNDGQGRQAIPSLSVEAPTPTDEQESLRHRAPPPPPPPPPRQQRKSPSPSNTIRTIWPSPLGIYDPTHPSTPERQRYMEKPLPPPPTPPAPSPPTRSERRPPPPPPSRFPPTTLTETIAERHRRLYQQHHPQQPQQHITSQLRNSRTPTSPLSLTSVLSPSPSPSPPPSPQGLTSQRYRSTNPPSPSPATSPRPPAPRYRATADGTGTGTAAGFNTHSGSGSGGVSRPGTAPVTGTGTRIGVGTGTATPLFTGREGEERGRLRSFSKADDEDFLVRKVPAEEERVRSGRERGRERGRRGKGDGDGDGDDAELFMDIIGEYYGGGDDQLGAGGGKGMGTGIGGLI